MLPSEVVLAFSGSGGALEGERYLEDEGLLDYLRGDDEQGRIPPDYRDLARLHQAVRARRVFAVLELGTGYSTLVMADALSKNKAEWDALKPQPSIRCSTPFQVHAVDTSKHWIEVTSKGMPPHLSALVSIHHSEAGAGAFHGRACHFYERLPDVVPDFIYLDGPDSRDVADGGGVGWKNPDRVVMAGDLLHMEPWLLPGTFVLADGRMANIRFLLAHLYRNWDRARSMSGDVSALELQEPPLGRIGEETLRYCLGSRIDRW